MGRIIRINVIKRKRMEGANNSSSSPTSEDDGNDSDWEDEPMIAFSGRKSAGKNQENDPLAMEDDDGAPGPEEGLAAGVDKERRDRHKEYMQKYRARQKSKLVDDGTPGSEERLATGVDKERSDRHKEYMRKYRARQKSKLVDDGTPGPEEGLATGVDKERRDRNKEYMRKYRARQKSKLVDDGTPGLEEGLAAGVDKRKAHRKEYMRKYRARQKSKLVDDGAPGPEEGLAAGVDKERRDSNKEYMRKYRARQKSKLVDDVAPGSEERLSAGVDKRRAHRKEYMRKYRARQKNMAAVSAESASTPNDKDVSIGDRDCLSPPLSPAASCHDSDSPAPPNFLKETVPEANETKDQVNEDANVTVLKTEVKKELPDNNESDELEEKMEDQQFSGLQTPSKKVVRIRLVQKKVGSKEDYDDEKKDMENKKRIFTPNRTVSKPNTTRKVSPSNAKTAAKVTSKNKEAPLLKPFNSDSIGLRRSRRIIVQIRKVPKKLDSSDDDDEEKDMEEKKKTSRPNRKGSKPNTTKNKEEPVKAKTAAKKKEESPAKHQRVRKARKLDPSTVESLDQANRCMAFAKLRTQRKLEEEEGASPETIEEEIKKVEEQYKPLVEAAIAKSKAPEYEQFHAEERRRINMGRIKFKVKTRMQAEGCSLEEIEKELENIEAAYKNAVETNKTPRLYSAWQEKKFGKNKLKTKEEVAKEKYEERLAKNRFNSMMRRLNDPKEETRERLRRYRETYVLKKKRTELEREGKTPEEVEADLEEFKKMGKLSSLKHLLGPKAQKRKLWMDRIIWQKRKLRLRLESEGVPPNEIKKQVEQLDKELKANSRPDDVERKRKEFSRRNK